MSDLKRRDFLRILGLTGAGATVAGCTQEPTQRLIPYLVPPENITPGLPTWYASTCRECPAGCGLYAKVREGRPIKVEGNPDHPLNHGTLCALGQSSLQGLYNPDRITGPMQRVSGGDFKSISWDDAEGMVADRIQELVRTGAADRVYLITDGSVSSLDRLFDRWMDALGSPNRVVHESFDLEPLREANRRTFGVAEIPRYDLDRADLILSFGAGFLARWISPVQYAHLFGRAHNLRPNGTKARFIHVAPRLSMTGSNADEWVSVRPGSETEVALAMAHALVSDGAAGAQADALRPIVEPFTPERAAQTAGIAADTIVRLAHEFASASASIALPPGFETTGGNATGAHIAVNLLNYAAGNIGRTVRFGPNVQRKPAAGLGRLEQVAAAMRGGEAELVLIHGTNPVHTLPTALEFASALQGAGLVVSFASYMDETAAGADLILPDHTPLESWGDHEPEVGVHSLMQPTLAPLFQTKSTGDVLLSVAEKAGGPLAQQLGTWSDFKSYLMDEWKSVATRFAPGAKFDDFWNGAVSRGGVWQAAPTQAVTLDRAVADYSFDQPDLAGSGSYTLLTYPSSTLYDGRGANRPWLQELPDPMTKVVWNSWVEIHPETAAELGVANGDVLKVQSPQGELEVPAYVYPGVRKDTVAIPIGQGHEAYGRYARGRGVNPLKLLPPVADAASDGLAWLSTRVQLTPTGRRTMLVDLQGSNRDYDREIAELLGFGAAVEAERRSEEEIRRNPDQLVPATEDADPKSPYRWGMVIDLASCIGCAACVTACYAENNVPVVGEERCSIGREMSWIRLERYYKNVTAEGGEAGGESTDAAPHIVHTPMLCQHCGNAPCEPVCPVYATYHDPEGLNVQVYNRCVGTRYCSNNCPYKVRRFEWFEYDFPFPLNLQLNPDVTVREKGVMEKCTFCVQRIHAAKNQAVAEGRPVVEDGEIVPACAQTCPTNAIVFGNLRDPKSRVARLARNGRGYHVLNEINTRPSITYLKEVVRGGGEA